MKINVERGAFLKALSHVQSVVERRNTIPILSNVMIEAGKGQLKLTATDLDIEIVEAIPADVLRNGSATAPAHMLYDIVRKLPEGAFQIGEQDGHCLDPLLVRQILQPLFLDLVRRDSVDALLLRLQIHFFQLVIRDGEEIPQFC